LLANKELAHTKTHATGIWDLDLVCCPYSLKYNIPQYGHAWVVIDLAIIQTSSAVFTSSSELGREHGLHPLAGWLATSGHILARGVTRKVEVCSNKYFIVFGLLLFIDVLLTAAVVCISALNILCMCCNTMLKNYGENAIITIHACMVILKNWWLDIMSIH
jgi:hypothetical protein